MLFVHAIPLPNLVLTALNRVSSLLLLELPYIYFTHISMKSLILTRPSKILSISIRKLCEDTDYNDKTMSMFKYMILPRTR